jgi:hypothetical protein
MVRLRMSVPEIHNGPGEKAVRCGAASPDGGMSRRAKPLYRQNLAKFKRGHGSVFNPEGIASFSPRLARF